MTAVAQSANRYLERPAPSSLADVIVRLRHRLGLVVGVGTRDADGSVSVLGSVP